MSKTSNSELRTPNSERAPASVEWQGCYELQWSGVIVPGAFCHPAKFSRGLIERIYDFCSAQGWLVRGDLIGDPFGGVGCGGIVAAYRGFQWVGVELEPRFVALGRENVALHAGKWRALGCPAPVLVQGDSRAFDVAVATAAGLAGIVTSPPYADSISAKESGIDWSKGQDGRDFTKEARHQELRKPMALEYGVVPGQIGSLKSGSLDGVITSPPYAKSLRNQQDEIDWEKAQQNGEGGGNHSKGKSCHATYGAGAEQISNLTAGNLDAVVTSPPYADIAAGAGGLNSKPACVAGQQCGRKRDSASQSADQRYGAQAGQISACRSGDLDAVVTSPPWENNAEGARKASRFGSAEKLLKCNRGHGASDEAVLAQAKRDEQKVYGSSTGQIGQSKGETYWEAMRAVYGACWRALRPGGVMAVVVKDYVAKGKRVPLCDDTCRLLVHVGFHVELRARAMLVHEQRHGDLFEGVKVVKRERKSFFRRLAERKGSPKIDWEEVIFAVKPRCTKGSQTDTTHNDACGRSHAKKSKESLSTPLVAT